MAAPAIVQGPKLSATPNDLTQSVTFTNPVAPGNLIVVFVQSFISLSAGAMPVPVVNDTKGNAYAPAVSLQSAQVGTFGWGYLQAYTAKAAAGGSGFTVNVDLASSGAQTGYVLIAYEVSGQHVTAPVETVSSGSGNSAAPALAALNTADAALCLALLATYGSDTTLTPGAGWTQGPENESAPAGVGANYSLITRAPSAAGAIVPSWACGQAEPFSAIALAIKPVAVVVPAPTLTSVTPGAGVRGATVAVALVGTGFVPGATTVNVDGSGVTVANVVASSATAATADLQLAPGAAAGARTVSVTTAGGTSSGQPFTVNLAAPGLTSVTPGAGVRGTTVPVALTGTDFVVGGTAVAVSGSGVTVANVLVASPNSLTADFVLAPGASADTRSVTVTTVYGTSSGQPFAVALPAPTLTAVAPNSGTRGTSVPVTLSGADFVPGATSVNVDGIGIAVIGVTVNSSTSISATFVLAGGALDGSRTVTVTTANGTSGGQAFTVTLPAPLQPTLATIAPNTGIRGTSVPVTLTGADFIPGATTVNVSGSGVAVANVNVTSPTELTASFVLAGGAAEGGRSVTVTTAGGTSNGQTFTVSLPLPLAPSLATITPSSGTRGTLIPIALTGTGFVVGATTVSVSGGGAAASNVVVSGTTSLTASLALSPGAADGARLVTVVTAGGVSNPVGFTVNLPAPQPQPSGTAVSALPGGMRLLVATLRADPQIVALLKNRAAVYSQVPQGLAPPYIAIRPTTETAFNSFGRGFGSNCTFDVMPTASDPGVAVLLDLVSRVRQLLDGSMLTLDVPNRRALFNIDSTVEPVPTQVGAATYWQQPVIVRMRVMVT